MQFNAMKRTKTWACS